MEMLVGIIGVIAFIGFLFGGYIAAFLFGLKASTWERAVSYAVAVELVCVILKALMFGIRPMTAAGMFWALSASQSDIVVNFAFNSFISLCVAAGIAFVVYKIKHAKKEKAPSG
jgi:hypothetical protein